MDQTNRSHFSKKSLPILLSISAFSILFSFSFFPMSDFSSQMFSYITDKNSIFLFCNGILVLIIKSSGLANNSLSDSEIKHEFVEKRADRVQPVVELAENKSDHKQVVVENLEEQEREYESLGEEEEEEEEKEKDGEYETEDEDGFFVEEDEGFEFLTTEELNKKCDDFIRKMREGIKIQA